MADFENVKRAYAAGQASHFRKLVTEWANDVTISNEEFSSLVTDLDWKQALERIQWMTQNTKIYEVDESRLSAVE